MLALGGAACPCVLLATGLWPAVCDKATTESATIKKPNPMARFIGAPSWQNYISTINSCGSALAVRQSGAQVIRRVAGNDNYDGVKTKEAARLRPPLSAR